MSTPDMTLGELGRRMANLADEVRQGRVETAEAVKAMRLEVHDQARRFDSEFLRKAEYAALQASDVMQMRGLEAEVHSIAKRLEAAEEDRKSELKAALERDRTNRALVISAFIAPLLVSLIVAFILRAGGAA